VVEQRPVISTATGGRASSDNRPRLRGRKPTSVRDRHAGTSLRAVAARRGRDEDRYGRSGHGARAPAEERGHHDARRQVFCCGRRRPSCKASRSSRRSTGNAMISGDAYSISTISSVARSRDRDRQGPTVRARRQAVGEKPLHGTAVRLQLVRGNGGMPEIVWSMRTPRCSPAMSAKRRCMPSICLGAGATRCHWQGRRSPGAG